MCEKFSTILGLFVKIWLKQLEKPLSTVKSKWTSPFGILKMKCFLDLVLITTKHWRWFPLVSHITNSFEYSKNRYCYTIDYLSICGTIETVAKFRAFLRREKLKRCGSFFSTRLFYIYVYIYIYIYIWIHINTQLGSARNAKVHKWKINLKEET